MLADSCVSRQVPSTSPWRKRSVCGGSMKSKPSSQSSGLILLNASHTETNLASGGGLQASRMTESASNIESIIPESQNHHELIKRQFDALYTAKCKTKFYNMHSSEHHRSQQQQQQQKYMNEQQQLNNNSAHMFAEHRLLLSSQQGSAKYSQQQQLQPSFSKEARFKSSTEQFSHGKTTMNFYLQASSLNPKLEIREPGESVQQQNAFMPSPSPNVTSSKRLSRPNYIEYLAPCFPQYKITKSKCIQEVFPHVGVKKQEDRAQLVLTKSQSTADIPFQPYSTTTQLQFPSSTKLAIPNCFSRVQINQNLKGCFDAPNMIVPKTSPANHIAGSSRNNQGGHYSFSANQLDDQTPKLTPVCGLRYRPFLQQPTLPSQEIVSKSEKDITIQKGISSNHQGIPAAATTTTTTTLIATGNTLSASNSKANLGVTNLTEQEGGIEKRMRSTFSNPNFTKERFFYNNNNSSGSQQQPQQLQSSSSSNLGPRKLSIISLAKNEQSTINEKQALQNIIEGLDLKSKSISVYDFERGVHVFGHKAGKVCEIASLTKIMTCYLICDLLHRTSFRPSDPVQVTLRKDDPVSVSKLASSMIGTSAMLLRGDHLSLWEALHGLMLPSGNDAAMALAESVGCTIVSNTLDFKLRRQANPTIPPPTQKEGYREFIRLMNVYAEKLKLRKTKFLNPHGLSITKNKSCAQDVSLLVRIAMQNSFFREIVLGKSFSVRIRNTKSNIVQFRDVKWENTNKLLKSSPFCLGVKTGVTPSAGPCLASAFRIGSRTFSIVVLNTPSMEMRFTETISIYNALLSALASRQTPLMYRPENNSSIEIKYLKQFVPHSNEQVVSQSEGIIVTKSTEAQKIVTNFENDLLYGQPACSIENLDLDLSTHSNSSESYSQPLIMQQQDSMMFAQLE